MRYWINFKISRNEVRLEKLFIQEYTVYSKAQFGAKNIRKTEQFYFTYNNTFSVITRINHKNHSLKQIYLMQQ